MTQRLPTAVARKDFANVLRDSAAGERIKLTRYNKTVAVIIPKKDLTDLEDCQRLHGVGAPADQKELDDKPPRAHASKAHAKAHKASER